MNQRIYYSKDAELQVKRERIASIALFLSLGLGIGAALALLFAPSSGKETRKELTNAFEDGFDSGRNATGKTINRLEKDFHSLKEWVEERMER